MSLENTRVIDFVATQNDGGEVVLTIADGWDWSDPDQHLMALQEKVNAYVEFVESGQLHEVYPRAKGSDVIIDVVHRVALSHAGLEFLQAAKAVVAAASISLKWRHVPHPVRQ